MNIIVVFPKGAARVAVHLRGPTAAEFDTTAKANAFAQTLQAAHGGPEKCRIVHRQEAPDDAA